MVTDYNNFSGKIIFFEITYLLYFICIIVSIIIYSIFVNIFKNTKKDQKENLLAAKVLNYYVNQFKIVVIKLFILV